MNLLVGANMQLRFWYKNPKGGDFSVYISNDGGVTYTTELATGLSGVSSWTEKIIDIPEGFTNNVVVVFKGTSNWGSGDAYIYLDEVTVQEKVSGATFAITPAVNGDQDFGSVMFNATAQKTYTITNNGDKPLFISIDSPEGFTAEMTANAEDKNVYFTDALNWAGEGVPNIYYWIGESNPGWPGKPMTYLYTNDQSQKVYYYELPDGVDGIIFNGDGKQTVNITDFTKNAYYTINEHNEQEGSNYKYGTWTFNNCVPAGQSSDMTITMNTASSGDKEGDVVLTFDALNATSSTIHCIGNVKDENYFYVDFNDNKFPEGWQVGADWDVSSGYAHQDNTKTPSALVTTPLAVAENQVLTFKVQRNKTGNSSYTKSLKVRYSTDGGVNWSGYTTYDSDYIGSSFSTFELTGVPVGTVIVEFFGNNFKLDDITGYSLATAPAIALFEGTTAVANGDTKDFGSLNANGTTTYTVKNIGNAPLNATITGENIVVEPANIEVAAGETKDVTVTLAYAEPYTTKNAKMTIDSEGWVGDFVVNFTAELVAPDAFVEDFSKNARPAGWYAENPGTAYYQGWVFTDGVAKNGANNSRRLITEKIGVEAGKNVLTFDASSSESANLTVSVSADRKNVLKEKTFPLNTTLQEGLTFDLQEGEDALADGEYYIIFETTNATIDNVKGVKKLALPAHDVMYLGFSGLEPNYTPGKAVSATISVANLLDTDENNVHVWAYYRKNGETDYSSTWASEQATIAAGNTASINLSAAAPAEEGVYDVMIIVSPNNDENDATAIQMQKDEVFTVAHVTSLAITGFAPVAATVDADDENNFTAEFSVTVENTGSKDIAANDVSVSITNNETGDDAKTYVTKSWTPDAQTIYLKAGNYKTEDANLAIYRWNEGEANSAEWALFTVGTDGIYTANLNNKADFIICRVNKDVTEENLGWDANVFNQSDNLTTAAGNVFAYNGYQQNDHLNLTQSNSLLAGMSVTMNITVTDAAGEGGNFKFKAKENVSSTWWSNGWYQTVKVNTKPTTVNVKVGTEGYTTFASAYSLDLSNLPDGLKAYKAKVNGANVTLTKIDQKVPANTGILLKGTYNYDGYSVNTVDKAEASAVADNDFLVKEQLTGSSDYIFALKKNSDLEFVRYTGSIDALPAGKAYLSVPASNFTGGARLSISFSDESTGIKTIDNSQVANENCYNLQGQKVQNAKKGGLYIVNGKKVVRK